MILIAVMRFASILNIIITSVLTQNVMIFIVKILIIIINSYLKISKKILI